MSDSEERPTTEGDAARPTAPRVRAHRQSHATARRPRRRWPVVTLTVLLLVSLGVAGYLYAAATAWEQRAQDLETTARGIGIDLAEIAQERDETVQTLTAAQDELRQADEQLAELADAVAQTGDDREVQRQMANYQAQLSAAASNVAQALESCIQGQDQVIGYLDEIDAWDAESLASFREQVSTYCEQATDAYEQLQTQIEGS